MDLNKITKEGFDKVYNKYRPNNIEIFVYKYFSTKTLRKDSWLEKYSLIFLSLLFLIGFTGAIFDSHKIILVGGYIFSSVFLIFMVPFLITMCSKTIRLYRIRKELGITKKEYDILVSKFYNL